MNIKIVKKEISVEHLQKMALDTFGDMVKAVVDINERVIAIGGEMHADAEKELIESGSEQDDLWGINLYPNNKKEMIVFESLINIRPTQGNMHIEIEDEEVRKKIVNIVEKLVK
jgi:hypothetical protein